MNSSEIEKRMYDFEKRQRELEVIIEELRFAKAAAEADAGKFAAFYQSATMGYFSIGQDSTIIDMNNSAAEILGEKPENLKNMKFRSFVTAETQGDFDEFLRNTFKFNSRQICEVRLKIENGISSFIYIEGMVPVNVQKCYMTVIDVTDRMLAEKTVYNLLNEKEIILKEVHHRVKNNMYNIGALLNMQANAQEDTAAKSVLFDAVGRVQSMSVLYDKLYRSEYTSAVSLKEYLPDLVYEIVNIFPQKKSVKIKTEIEDVVLDAKILSILGILVNELVTNSMKYAFNGKSDGVITVTVTRKEKSALIIVADNGIGIPEIVTFQSSKGFGMQLVSMLTEQINGSIEIERGGGTRFILEFPV